MEESMRLSLTLAALAALGLAACDSKPAADGAATTGDSSAAAPAGPAAPEPAASAALAADMEGPSAGKWRVTISSEGMPVMPNEVCYKAKTTLAEAEQAQRQAGVTCSEQSYRREGDAIVSHSVCTVQGMKMTTDMRVTGDFNAKYTMDMTTTMDPAPAPGMGTTKMSIVSERIGDC
jgi:hypothetical protein